VILASGAWGKMRFSQAFPVLLGGLALLLLAKAPGKLTDASPPDPSPSEESRGAPDAPVGPPAGGARNEAPEDNGGPIGAWFTIELSSRHGSSGVRVDKSGIAAAIVSDHRDPVFDRSRSRSDSFENAYVPSRPASPFAPRAPPADLVETAGTSSKLG